MEIDVGARRSGKTDRMLDWLESAPPRQRYILVCHSHTEVERLRKLVKDEDRNINPNRIVSVDQIGTLRGLRGSRHSSLAIDNVDLVLPSLLGHPVSRISATGNDEAA